MIDDDRHDTVSVKFTAGRGERERGIMDGLEVRSYYGTVYAGMGWVDHRPHDTVYDIVNSRDEAMTL